MAGILQTYGSHAIQRTIIDHKDTILQSADWSNNSYGELGQGQAGLPEPPKAIDNCTHGECKVLIVAIMKSVVGHGFDKHVGWGPVGGLPMFHGPREVCSKVCQWEKSPSCCLQAF